MEIYPPYRIFYFECVKSAADSAIRSWEQINNIVTSQELFDSQSITLIDLAENIVNQAGIISRYFYPSVERRNIDKNRIHELRSEKLRELFLVDKSSIIANRKFRNYIEHFDENLDQFLNQPIAGNICPKLILIDKNELDALTYIFKAFVVNQFTFISLSQEIDLIPLVKEIYRIYNVCVDE